MFRLGAIAALAVATTGCAFHRTPWPAYEGSHPRADTAVFASFDINTAKYVDARITRVDTTKTASLEAGHPYWVRVKPGAHTFHISYSTNFRVGSHSQAMIEVPLTDMKPGHVYIARYREAGGRVAVRVEDMGEKPDFGIPLGLDGVNAKTYKVEF